MDKNQEPVTQTEEKTEGKSVTQTENKTEEKVEKTFTQADMNKLEMKIENKFKEKYKGYDEWLENQKSETEKHQETLKENETLKNRIAELENIQVVANANVDSKFQKFVLSEVSVMEGDFEDNLKSYLKDNSQYLKITPEETPKDTGVPVKKLNEKAESGVTAILKEKHPELFK